MFEDLLVMLVTHLDELFFGFQIGGEIAEEQNKNRLAKLLYKIAKPFAWMWGQLFLITITGGLYIPYVIFKTVRKRRTNRKNRRRA